MMNYKFVMKKILLIIVIIICYHVSEAQVIDYNRIIIPQDARNVSTEELLVQLAWNNQPDSKILMFKRDIAVSERKLSSLEWVGLFGFNGNLNEYNIQQFTGTVDNTGNQFFPRYNFYLNLPFSSFYEIPLNKKIKHFQVNVANEDINNAKLNIRNKVLNAYSNFIRAQKILKIKNDFAELATSNFLTTEEDFKNGRIPLDQYYTIYRTYQQQLIEKADAEYEFQTAKNDLELLIGVPVDDIIKE